MCLMRCVIPYGFVIDWPQLSFWLLMIKRLCKPEQWAQGRSEQVQGLIFCLGQLEEAHSASMLGTSSN